MYNDDDNDDDKNNDDGMDLYLQTFTFKTLNTNVFRFLFLQFKSTLSCLFKATILEKVRDKEAINMTEEPLDSCYIWQTLSISLDWCI